VPVGAAAALAVALVAGGAGSASFTVAIGGDVSLARGIEARAAREGWERVLAPLGEALSGADARIVNLESASGACLGGGTVERPRLCGQARPSAQLARAGVTAVTVANNHGLDAGEPGLDGAVAELRRVRMTVLGAEALRTGKPKAEPLGPIVVVTANLARPAWPPGRAVPLPSPDEVGAVVRAAREQDAAKPVLVILHGGREMDPEPSSFERAYAQAAVEAGAAAVVFNGAHVVRPLETIAAVPVHFGLGNLLFDQHKVKEGEVLLLRFRPGAAAEVIAARCVQPTTARRCRAQN
jgi:hypothetical protein